MCQAHQREVSESSVALLGWIWRCVIIGINDSAQRASAFTTSRVGEDKVRSSQRSRRKRSRNKEARDVQGQFHKYLNRNKDMLKIFMTLTKAAADDDDEIHLVLKKPDQGEED